MINIYNIKINKILINLLSHKYHLHILMLFDYFIYKNYNFLQKIRIKIIII